MRKPCHWPFKNMYSSSVVACQGTGDQSWQPHQSKDISTYDNDDSFQQMVPGVTRIGDLLMREG